MIVNALQYDFGCCTKFARNYKRAINLHDLSAWAKNIIMKWKMFLRTNGRWSISHLCDENNKCVCGWKYTPDEYTEIKEFGTMPDIACSSCENSETDNSSVRWANLRTRTSN